MSDESKEKPGNPQVDSADYYDAFARECCYTESYRRTPWGEYFHLKRRIGSMEKAVAEIGKSFAVERAADIGCGDGILLPALCKVAKQVVGTDISPERLKLAEKMIPNCPNLSLQVMDVMKDRANEPFDLVTCSEVIEHVSDPAEFFHRLAELIKPGGHLVLSTPSRWGIREKTLRLQQMALNVVQNRLRGKNEQRWRFFHIGLLKIRELDDLAKKYFSNYSLSSVGFYLPVVTELSFSTGNRRLIEWYEDLDTRIGKSSLGWVNWTQILIARK